MPCTDYDTLTIIISQCAHFFYLLSISILYAPVLTLVTCLIVLQFVLQDCIICKTRTRPHDNITKKQHNFITNLYILNKNNNLIYLLVNCHLCYRFYDMCLFFPVCKRINQ